MNTFTVYWTSVNKKLTYHFLATFLPCKGDIFYMNYPLFWHYDFFFFGNFQFSEIINKFDGTYLQILFENSTFFIWPRKYYNAIHSSIVFFALALQNSFFKTLSYLAFDTHCFHSILMRYVFTYVNDRDRKQTILWKGHQAQLRLPLPKIVHLRTECTVLRIFIFK